MLNLDKAFEVNAEKYIKGKKVLLIDDICTTGSTFEEMIKTLNASGINDITCFATTTPWES
jgi:predicted amidophosphoribosyltransferase